MKYDYLIVGAGLFGAVFARQMKEKGKKCLVIDRRNHIAGNIYTQAREDIQVHMYGPHIFHTDNEMVWNYMNRFTTFNHFIYSPLANYKGELYNLPFNMNTFYKMWGVMSPKEAKAIIEKQILECSINNPQNLEEQALTLVGSDIFNKLVKGYTEKQWGRPCTELPAFIMRRLPLRFTFNNNYFNHPYQGIPIDGYTQMVKNMLDGIDVQLNEDYLEHREHFTNLSQKIVYTGTIDEYYGYCYGELEYRSLRFEHEILDMTNYQGVAGMNYTDSETSFTRIIEHKHFEYDRGNSKKTIITREYPAEWKKGDQPFYPINDYHNTCLYERYKKLADDDKNVIFGGRLGLYQYFDMDKVILKALEMSEKYS